MVLGLLLSLGVYLLGLATFAVVVVKWSRPPGGLGTTFEVIAGASVAASAVVSRRQRRRGHDRTASGAVVGTIVWPMIMYFLFAWALGRAMSHATIPW